jgi:hypothetical protein
MPVLGLLKSFFEKKQNQLNSRAKKYMMMWFRNLNLVEPVRLKKLIIEKRKGENDGLQGASATTLEDQA